MQIFGHLKHIPNVGDVRVIDDWELHWGAANSGGVLKRHVRCCRKLAHLFNIYATGRPSSVRPVVACAWRLQSIRPWRLCWRALRRRPRDRVAHAPRIRILPMHDPSARIDMGAPQV
jgi:hypothetical protein